MLVFYSTHNGLYEDIWPLSDLLITPYIEKSVAASMMHMTNLLTPECNFP